MYVDVLIDILCSLFTQITTLISPVEAEVSLRFITSVQLFVGGGLLMIQLDLVPHPLARCRYWTLPVPQSFCFTIQHIQVIWSQRSRALHSSQWWSGLVNVSAVCLYTLSYTDIVTNRFEA